MLELLRNRNFRLLWLGQLFSQLGDRLTQLVLVALVAHRAGGSTMTLAKVLVLTSLPALLLNPLAGAYVDRWDRKRVMIFCDLIRMAIVLLLPWWATLSHPIPFYLAVFSLFGVASFFVPARLALIPDLVSTERLAEANALFTSSGLVGSTVILLIGALLIEWIGVAKSSWVNAACYLGSATMILLIRRCISAPKAGPSTRLIVVEILEGIRRMWSHSSTRRAMGLVALLMGGAGASVVVGTVLVQRHLGTVTKDLGFLSLWLGVGMLLGALGYGRWGVRWERRRILGWAFLACGAVLLGFLAAVLGLRSGVAASISAGLLGVCLAPVGIVTNTLIHEAHPERLHGRIFGSLGVVVNLAWIISMLLAGWIAERWTPAGVLGVVASGFAWVGLILLYCSKRLCR
jgi:DHA3 family macrolide efflux protein-like MFS transporter